MSPFILFTYQLHQSLIVLNNTPITTMDTRDTRDLNSAGLPLIQPIQFNRASPRMAKTYKEPLPLTRLEGIIAEYFESMKY